MTHSETVKQYYKQKALDQALWLDFVNRVQQSTFSVIELPPNDYVVLPTENIPRRTMIVGEKPKDYTHMNYEQISKIRADIEPLHHWEELIGLFSVADGELLRFILKYKIPIKKIIAYELASRGFDENHVWCGFERAKEVWLK